MNPSVTRASSKEAWMQRKDSSEACIWGSFQMQHQRKDSINPAQEPQLVGDGNGGGARGARGFPSQACQGGLSQGGSQQSVWGLGLDVPSIQSGCHGHGDKQRG